METRTYSKIDVLLNWYPCIFSLSLLIVSLYTKLLVFSRTQQVLSGLKDPLFYHIAHRLPVMRIFLVAHTGLANLSRGNSY